MVKILKTVMFMIENKTNNRMSLTFNESSSSLIIENNKKLSYK